MISDSHDENDRETIWYSLNINSRQKVLDYRKLKIYELQVKKCNILKCMSQYLRLMSLKMRWPWIWATFGNQTTLSRYFLSVVTEIDFRLEFFWVSSFSQKRNSCSSITIHSNHLNTLVEWLSNRYANVVWPDTPPVPVTTCAESDIESTSLACWAMANTSS